ncbi:MFS transporter [Amycolatopsis acidicola]|uniref:MFS transporter n=1 Tax=Amycolatopsis acidicola TaxID=2596893 RepID=A0A5N0UVE0_9PSEU|nr:MFS transporter [Amycolatopsis acidicola]KAA9156778.1 MFS transporter [Amycolatopsis acidicola]
MSRAATPRAVVLTCLAVTTLDGLDLAMFGAVLPTLLEKKVWGMTTIEAGLIGSLSLIGMMIGAMLAGYLIDKVGRRPVALLCVACFSIFTALCAIAPNLPMFAAFRLLGGIGFGGGLPTAIALTMEYVPRARRQFYNGVIQTGFTIGGALVAILAIFVVPSLGWQALFAFGGLIGLVLLAIALKTLPESLTFLAGRGRSDEAAALAAKYGVSRASESGAAAGARVAERVSPVRSLFVPGFRVATVLFPLISFCGLLCAYGMNTWIPQILRSSGYNLGSSLTFLLVYYVGSGMGMVVLSGLADGVGPRRIVGGGFFCGGIAVAVVALHPAQAFVFVLVLLIGFCSSSQTALSGFVGVYYPPNARGTALGLAVGLGRLGGVVGPIMVGTLVASTVGSTGTFYAFAVICLVAAVLTVLVPRTGLLDRSAKKEAADVSPLSA